MSERTEVRPPAGETEGQKITRATRSLDVKITADLTARARRHDQGGWRLGLLVARNVEKGADNGRPRNLDDRRGFQKVSTAAFAKASSTSDHRVARYLEAWTRATQAGHVPAASGGGCR